MCLKKTVPLKPDDARWAPGGVRFGEYGGMGLRMDIPVVVTGLPTLLWVWL